MLMLCCAGLLCCLYGVGGMSMNWRVKVSSYIQIIGSSSSSPSPCTQAAQSALQHHFEVSKGSIFGQLWSPAGSAVPEVTCYCWNCPAQVIVAIDYLEDHPHGSVTCLQLGLDYKPCINGITYLGNLLTRVVNHTLSGMTDDPPSRNPGVSLDCFKKTGSQGGGSQSFWVSGFSLN